MSAYPNLMSIRRLFAILVAVAVLFAPAFTNAGMAYAAVPDHHAQMAEEGHCDGAKDMDQDVSAGMACCGPVCMAVATVPAAAPLAKPMIGGVPFSSLHGFPPGIPAELATPPPRVA